MTSKFESQSLFHSFNLCHSQRVWLFITHYFNRIFNSLSQVLVNNYKEKRFFYHEILNEDFHFTLMIKHVVELQKTFLGEFSNDERTFFLFFGTKNMKAFIKISNRNELSFEPLS